MFTFYALCYLGSQVCSVVCDHEHVGAGQITHSIIQIRYNDSKTGKLKEESKEYGHYGTNSRIAGEEGVLVHVRSIHNRSEGCDIIDPSVVPSKRWIALIKRGNCSFNDKIYFATKKSNASAVVLYNNQSKTLQEDQGRVVPLPETTGPHNGKYFYQLVPRVSFIALNLSSFQDDLLAKCFHGYVTLLYKFS